MKIAVVDANAFWTEQLYSACANFADILLLKPRDFRAHRSLHGRYRSDAAPRKISDRVWEQRLSMPPGWMFTFWSWVEHRFVRAIRSFAGDDELILVITYPQYRSLIGRLRPARSVYYNLDDYSDNWPTRAESIGHWERETVQTADLTICIANHRAELLRQAIPGKAQGIAHLTIGCTPSFMSNAGAERQIPAAFSRIARPIAGYVGALNYRFDFEFLAAVATEMPDVQFVLGGRTPEAGQGSEVWWRGYEKTRRLPNVHYLGWVEHAQLGDYLQAFNAAVICYSDCRFNTNASPAKLWDYMGSGTPIVANDRNPETRLWSEVVRIGRTPGEFAEQLRVALTNDSPRLRERRLQIAREHTWSRLSERFRGLLAQKDAGSVVSLPN